MSTLPETIRSHFIHAGWQPGRKVAVDNSISIDHPAAAILREFGGLCVGVCGAGEECGTSQVLFRMLARDDVDLRRSEELLRTELIGIADVSSGHEDLLVARDGRFFGQSGIHDALYFYGSSFADAMERLLLGRRAQPVLKPNQDAVSLYGIVFRRGDSAVYVY